MTTEAGAPHSTASNPDAELIRLCEALPTLKAAYEADARDGARLDHLAGHLADMMGAARALELLATGEDWNDDPRTAERIRAAVEWIGKALVRDIHAGLCLTDRCNPLPA